MRTREETMSAYELNGLRVVDLTKYLERGGEEE